MIRYNPFKQLETFKRDMATVPTNSRPALVLFKLTMLPQRVIVTKHFLLSLKRVASLDMVSNSLEHMQTFWLVVRWGSEQNGPRRGPVDFVQRIRLKRSCQHITESTFFVTCFKCRGQSHNMVNQHQLKHVKTIFKGQEILKPLAASGSLWQPLAGLYLRRVQFEDLPWIFKTELGTNLALQVGRLFPSILESILLQLSSH